MIGVVNGLKMNDERDKEARYVIDWCKAINAFVCVRGADPHITVNVFDKTTKRPLNDIAVARRMEKALKL